MALIVPSPELAASTTSAPRLEQPLAPRIRSANECTHDSDCSEHRFGFCGYLDDGRGHDNAGQTLAVLRHRGRTCIYAMCASTACREEALPTPSKDLAHDHE